MNSRLEAGVFVAIAVFAGAGGFYLSRGNTTLPVTDGAAQRLMLTSLPDLSGKSQAVSQWRGKVLVVNFWATWCAPCREEIPALIRVQHKYASNSVQFIGIGIDNVSKIREYADEMGIDYVLLVGGMEALRVVKDSGNGAGVLPFTVVLDRAGNLAYAHAGALTEASLGAVLTALL